jgi:hypothetical protein
MSPQLSATIIDAPDHKIVLRDEWLVAGPHGLDCPWMPRTEIAALCYYAKMCGGNIVEIGCNEGNTTAALAFNNLDRRIYAIDWTQSTDKMISEQHGEKPQALGKYAREFSNVEIIGADSSLIHYDPEWNVRMIFIDGGHDYAQVKRDLEKAIDHLQHDAGGYVFWHDYGRDRPLWVEVASYIEREIVPFYDLFAIRDTALVFIRVESLPRERERIRSKIVALERECKVRNESIYRLQTQNRILLVQLQVANERWDRLRRSWSWSLTRPVRVLGRIQRKFMRVLARTRTHLGFSVRGTCNAAEGFSPASPELMLDETGPSPSAREIWLRLMRLKLKSRVGER